MVQGAKSYYAVPESSVGGATVASTHFNEVDCDLRYKFPKFLKKIVNIYC